MRKGLKKVVSKICVGALILTCMNGSMFQNFVTGEDSVIIEAATGGTYTASQYKMDYTKFSSYVQINKITITASGTSLVTVNVPSAIEGLPVTTIGDSAFYGQDRIYRVNLPSSVTGLRYRAFAKCPSLQVISLSGNIVRSKCGTQVFYATNNITTVYAPNPMNDTYILDQLKHTAGGAKWMKQYVDAIVYLHHDNYKRNYPDGYWNLDSLSTKSRELAKYYVAQQIHKDLSTKFVKYNTQEPLCDTAYCLVTEKGNSMGMARAYILLLKKCGFHDDELQLVHRQGQAAVGIKICDNWFFTDPVSASSRVFATYLNDCLPRDYSASGNYRGYTENNTYLNYTTLWNAVSHEDYSSEMHVSEDFPTPFWGDADASWGSYPDIVDVATLNKYLGDVKKTGTKVFDCNICLPACDMNHDGLINNDDLNELSQASMNYRK